MQHRWRSAWELPSLVNIVERLSGCVSALYDLGLAYRGLAGCSGSFTIASLINPTVSNVSHSFISDGLFGNFDLHFNLSSKYNETNSRRWAYLP